MHILADAGDFEISIHKSHVDRKFHKVGVDAGAGSYPKSAMIFKTLSTQESLHAVPVGIRFFQFGA